MERVDLGHGRGWLTPAPAASIRRIDADLGRPLDINSAGRTYEEQAKARADYLAGRGAYALPAGSSIHELGAAIDSDDLGNSDFVTWLEEHGWFRTALARGEWWHAEYDPTRDQHRNDPITQEDTDMPIHLHREKTGVTYTVVPSNHVKQHPDAANGNIASYITTGSKDRRDFRRLNDGDLSIALYDLGFPELGADLSKLPAARSKRSPHGYYWCGRGKPGYYS